jgi:hypothetical protein
MPRAVPHLDADLDNGTRLDGQYYGIGARPSYTFDDRSIGSVFGGWAVNDRTDPGVSYDFHRLGTGYSRELPIGLIAYVAPEVRLRDFAPFVSFTYENNDSSIEFFDYDRLRE